MKLLKVSDEVYQYYKDHVRGNENISFDQTRRKLTRNVLLAKKVVPRSKFERFIGNTYYHFGNLHLVVRWNKVVGIKNHSGGGKHYGNWHMDIEKYNRLTIELGIEYQVS